MRKSQLEKLQEAEACARCEHEKRLGIEQQRDELLAALKKIAAPGAHLDSITVPLAIARDAIAKVEGEKRAPNAEVRGRPEAGPAQ